MQIIYARFNRHRLPEFQLSTTIFRENGLCYVAKKALTPAAVTHLQAMRNARQLMIEQRSSPDIIIPALINDRCTDDTLVFEYIDAPSVDQILFQALTDRDSREFWRVLDEYHQLLHDAFGTKPLPVVGDELRTIFGTDIDARLAGDAKNAKNVQNVQEEKDVKDVNSAEGIDDRGPCAGIAFLDPVFENVLARGQQRVFIDNEWVAPGALPIGFAMFRSLFYFFKVKYPRFNLEETVSMESAMERYKITGDDAALYQTLDELFQTHVFGAERCFNYLHKYARYSHTSVASMQQTIEHQRQVIKDMHGQMTAMMRTRGWQILVKIRKVCPWV